MSALENETLHDTTTFEHFGRSWTVPTKRHLTHMRWMRDQFRLNVGGASLVVAEAFLSASVSPHNVQPKRFKADQFAELLDLDPDEEALDGFAEALSAAMGFGDGKGDSSGNSSPSSASS